MPSPSELETMQPSPPELETMPPTLLPPSAAAMRMPLLLRPPLQHLRRLLQLRPPPLTQPATSLSPRHRIDGGLPADKLKQ